MIVEWLLSALGGLAVPFLTLASWTGDPVAGDLGGLALLTGSVGDANRYLPIDQFLVAIVAGLTFDLLVTGSTFLVFVYRLIPFKFT